MGHSTEAPGIPHNGEPHSVFVCVCVLVCLIERETGTELNQCFINGGGGVTGCCICWYVVCICGILNGMVKIVF